MYEGLNIDDGWLQEFIEDARKFTSDNRQRLDAAFETGEWPRDIYEKMGSRGWVGPLARQEFGGLGGEIPHYCVLVEELTALKCPTPHNAIEPYLWIEKWGNEDQRKEWLVDIVAGRSIVAVGITEPDAGSSLKKFATTATPVSDGYRITGTKKHSSLAAIADAFIVFAKEEGEMSAFIVPTESIGKKNIHRANPIGDPFVHSGMTNIDVVVPTAARLGAKGDGFKMLVSAFNIARLGNASIMIATGRRALGAALDFAAQRQVGETMVDQFQGNRWSIAKMFQSLWTASLARNIAANQAVQSGRGSALFTALAKLAAIDACEHVTRDVFGLVGGEGLYMDAPYGALTLEARMWRTVGGSSEVLYDTVARELLQRGGRGALNPFV